MKNTLCFALLFLHFIYAKPMESINKYNVILVHGAGGRYFGMDCDGKDYEEANGYRPKKDGKIIENEYLELTGGYGKSLGLSTEPPFILEDRESSAEDMDKKNDDGEYNGLRHWLTEDIFGRFGESNSFDKSIVYLQRPFTNPANSPVNNAKELGDPTWIGNNKCSERRSLIEEAQEVRTKGRDSLNNLRKSVENRNKLPPSRNILIAHSMGGVASREYVQGNDYNNDVDKVITLDSPHDGTEGLC